MTLRDYQNNIAALISQGAERAIESVIVPAANGLLAAIKNRIALDGKNSNGGQIGSYSTKPAYYGKQQFTKTSSFKAVGKTGEKKFADGRAHKTQYFEQGYKGLRSAQGKVTDKMNLNYSGSTLLAYQLQAAEKYVILGLVTERASDIRKGQEKKRGRIFYATTSEIEAYNTEVAEGSAEITKRILGA